MHVINQVLVFRPDAGSQEPGARPGDWGDNSTGFGEGSKPQKRSTDYREPIPTNDDRRRHIREEKKMKKDLTTFEARRLVS